MPIFAFAAAGAFTILAVVLIVLVLVFYLVSIIVQLRKITVGLDEVVVGPVTALEIRWPQHAR